MKIREIKKYVVGFIIGLLFIYGVSFASDSGYIGALFENISGNWYLKGENIKDESIASSKIIDKSITSDKIGNNTITEDNIIDTFKARNSDKLDGKNSTLILGEDDTTIPTSKAVKDYVDTNTDGGVSSLNDLTDAKREGYNLFIGHKGNKNTGNYNTALGLYSLYNNAGKYNTANGNMSLYSNTTGNYNTALGLYSLYNNETGSSNIANGYYSLGNNTSGRHNTAIGYYSLLNNINGNHNIAIGTQSLQLNKTGDYNTAIGIASLMQNTTGSRNIAIGYNAGLFETGSNKLYIANSSTKTPLIYGDFSKKKITINGSLTQASDERFKKNIKTINNSLKKVIKLRGVNFEWKDSEQFEEGKQIGLIAQEVEKIFPETVFTNDNGDKSVNYSRLVAPLIEAVKEQQNQIDKQQQQIDKLEKIVEELKK